MKTNTRIAQISLVLALALSSSAPAADAPAPNADQILRQMSAQLAAARSFTFEAKREIDPALTDGLAAAEKASVAVAIQRPNKLAARAASRDGVRRFIFNGRTLTVADEKEGFHATVPMRTNIDGLVEALDAVYGFTPPLAEFALSNPYADIRRHAHTVTYLGKARLGGFLGMGGVECHRLGLKGQLADAELLIAVGDQLPRKLVATFHRAGQPQVRIDFSAWNLAAPVTSADFTFTAPKGTQKIEMWTTAKMNTARKP